MTNPTEPTISPQRKRTLTAGATKAGLLATGLVAVVAAAGVGGPALARSLDGGTPGAIAEVRRAPVELQEATAELGDVTLDSLADELAELGLRIEITPVDEQGDRSDDADPDDPFAGLTDAEVDALSDEEFFARLEAAGIDPESDVDFDDQAGDEPDTGFADGEDDEHGGPQPELLGTFAVTGDRIATGDATPEVAAKANEIWERFVKLIPADQRQMVSSFELDGERGGGAYVYPNENDESKWTLGVSVGLDDDLDYVLIHEFGHLLTLQAKEVPPSDDAEGCATYYTGEGCALSGSTFATFVQQFWPQELLTELEQIEDYDGQDAFYQKHKDKFVTDYATSNPGEDLAETFAVFVTEDRPTGDTVADQKVQFLWNDPSMVSLREQILANR